VVAIECVTVAVTYTAITMLLRPRFEDERLASATLYRYGFVCYPHFATPDLAPVQHWNRFAVADHVVHAHREAQVQIVSLLGGTAVVIGDMHVASGRGTVDDVLKAFVNERNWDAFDRLSGRFALLVFAAGGVTVLHDPFASSTLFYRLLTPCAVGSNAALVAEMFGHGLDKETVAFRESPEYKLRGTAYLPGDLTMFSSVVGLAANNCLDLITGKTSRYWPRRPVAATTMDEFLAATDEYFGRFADFLRGKYRPVLGLTGGVDSRAVIAGLRHQGLECRTLTWSRLPENEIPVVKAMRDHLRVEHEFVDVKRTAKSPAFSTLRSVANVNSGLSRGPSTLTSQMAEVSRPGEVFIRGLGGEILRGFYNRHRRRGGEKSLAEFHALYLTNKLRDASPAFSKFARVALEGFMQRANYDQDFYNIDPLDLFYWEQRMAMWAAVLLNEMDPAIYNIVGMNSRVWYERAFGLPMDARLGSQLLLDVTARYDPVFAALRTVS
jgi:hypothetical protein